MMNSFAKMIEAINTKRQAGDDEGVNWELVMGFVSELNAQGFFTNHDQILEDQASRSKYYREAYLNNNTQPTSEIQEGILALERSLQTDSKIGGSQGEISQNEEILRSTGVDDYVYAVTMTILEETSQDIEMMLSVEECGIVVDKIQKDREAAANFLHDRKRASQIVLWDGSSIKLSIIHQCHPTTHLHYLVTDSGELFVIEGDDFGDNENWTGGALFHSDAILFKGFKHGTSLDVKNLGERLDADRTAIESVLANW
jgi:hypothetical protein